MAAAAAIHRSSVLEQEIRLFMTERDYLSILDNCKNAKFKFHDLTEAVHFFAGARLNVISAFIENPYELCHWDSEAVEGNIRAVLKTDKIKFPYSVDTDEMKPLQRVIDANLFDLITDPEKSTETLKEEQLAIRSKFPQVRETPFFPDIPIIDRIYLLTYLLLKTFNSDVFKTLIFRENGYDVDVSFQKKLVMQDFKALFELLERIKFEAVDLASNEARMERIRLISTLCFFTPPLARIIDEYAMPFKITVMEGSKEIDLKEALALKPSNAAAAPQALPSKSKRKSKCNLM